jgi:hypothetical protein
MNWGADIDATILWWQRHHVDASDAYWALGYRGICSGGWGKVRWHMMRLAQRWEGIRT